MALNLRNPNGYDGQPATHTKQGIVRLATDAEIAAGTADNVAVTPAQLTGSVPVPLTVPLGGTGLTTITDHGVMVGSGTGAVTPLAVGTNGQVLTGATGADPSFAALGTNSGLTAHGVLVGEGNSAIAAVATSATAGVPLVSAGAAADPAFGTAVVAGGGTGVTSATAYAVLTGGTTATGAFQSVASVGAAGEVLTSNGAGALPSFQAAPGGIGISVINTTITSAEFKALNVTPKVILAAQGANTVIWVIAQFATMVYAGTNPFTSAAGALVGSYLGTTSLGNAFDDSWYTQSSSQTANFAGFYGRSAASNWVNQDLNWQASDVINGNAADDNYILVTTYYAVLATV